MKKILLISCILLFSVFTLINNVEALDYDSAGVSSTLTISTLTVTSGEGGVTISTSVYIDDMDGDSHITLDADVASIDAASITCSTAAPVWVLVDTMSVTCIQEFGGDVVAGTDIDYVMGYNSTDDSFSLMAGSDLTGELAWGVCGASTNVYVDNGLGVGYGGGGGILQTIPTGVMFLVEGGYTILGASPYSVQFADGAGDLYLEGEIECDGAITVGAAASPTYTDEDDDIYVEDDLEVGGTIETQNINVRADGGLILYDVNNTAYLTFNGTTDGLIRGKSGTVDEFLIGVGTNYGRQVVITDAANRNKDHDHATPTSPTLYIQSEEDPDDDNTGWMSLSFSSDSIKGTIDVGSGFIEFVDGLAPYSRSEAELKALAPSAAGHIYFDSTNNTVIVSSGTGVGEFVQIVDGTSNPQGW